MCCVFSTFIPASSGLYSAQVVAQLLNYVCVVGGLVFVVFSTFMPASSGLYSAQVVAQLVNYVCVVGGSVFVVSSLPSSLHYLGYILLKS